MKTIKEKAEIYLKEEDDEILCVYDRYAGFVDGANYALKEIENCLNEFDNYNDSLIIARIIKELKK